MYIYVYMYIHIYVYNIYILYDVYAIMKTVCSPGYHHNGFVATHALVLGHIWLHIAGTNEPKSA